VKLQIALMLLLVTLSVACDKQVQDIPAVKAADMPTVAAEPAPASDEIESAELGVDIKPESVSKMNGAVCTTSKEGEKSCSVDTYTIDIFESGCSADGLYGAVSTKESATLVDGISGVQAKPTAKLQDKQIVCIQASAHKGKEPPQWHYVKAIPVASIAGCKNNDLCETYGDRVITEVQAVKDKPCALNAKGMYEGNCAAGWIKAEAFEEFSMGL
jgi:hypothetical protein